MSILGIPFTIGHAASGFVIENAIVLNGVDEYLHWTPGTTEDDDQRWIMGLWLHRLRFGDATTSQAIFNAGDNATEQNGIQISAASSGIGADHMFWWTYGGATDGYYREAADRRDPAWEHWLFSYDYTASGTEKQRMWHNGVEVTAWQFNPASNDTALFMKNGKKMGIGYDFTNGVSWLPAYIAQPFGVDGLSLQNGDYAVTDFIDTDVNGAPIPVDLAATIPAWGTNGWHLDFADSGDLGNDVSGNGNDWTLSNIDGANQVAMSPSDDAGRGIGSYAVFNALHHDAAGTLSDGNLAVSGGSEHQLGTIPMASGKWTWAVTVGSTESQSHGIESLGGTETLHIESLTAGDVLQFRFDADAGTLDKKRNGDAWESVATGLTSGPYLPLCKGDCTVDFGQRGFTGGDAGAGHKLLCTANLPAPVVDDPSQYVQVALTAHGGTAENIACNWDLDAFDTIVWSKNRDSAEKHYLSNGLRGYAKYNRVDSSETETTDANVHAASGTTLTLGSTFAADDYVTWLFRCGTAGGVPNMDGSITTTVSVADHGGMAMGTYTGTHAVATCGHGLSGLDMLFVTNLEKTTAPSAENFMVWHKGLSSGGYFLQLDTANAENNTSNVFNATDPGSSVFTVGAHTSVNENGDSHWFWALRRTPGLIGIGTYTGDGTYDGPYIVVDDGASGFRPAWVMFKTKDTAARNWWVVDSQRSPDNNTGGDELTPDTNGTEGGGMTLDLTANGFKVRNGSENVNKSGDTFVYLAFAEFPFGGSGVAQARAR